MKLLSSFSRALMKGADLLSTLAYVLAPPEPSETTSEGKDKPSDSWSRPMEVRESDDGQFVFPASVVVIPPEAETMISKPVSAPRRTGPAEPLSGSVADRLIKFR